MSQSEDLQAIADMFNRVAINTPEAGRIKTAFGTWYKNLSWYERNMDSSVYNEARVRRNAFNLANAKTAAQQEDVRRVIATGLTTEEMKGEIIPITSAEKKRILSSPIATGRETIRQGSRGPAVMEWQGVLGLTKDGVFGPKTYAATVAYQKAHGLVADGIVGPKTWGTVQSTAHIVDSDSRPMPTAEQIKAAQSSAPMPTLARGKPNPRAPKTSVNPFKSTTPKKRTPTKRKPRPAPKPLPKIAKTDIDALKFPPAPKVSEAGIFSGFGKIKEEWDGLPFWGKLGATAALIGIVGSTVDYSKKTAEVAKKSIRFKSRGAPDTERASTNAPSTIRDTGPNTVRSR